MTFILWREIWIQIIVILLQLYSSINWHTLWWLFWYIYLPNTLVFCIIFHWPRCTTSDEGLCTKTGLPMTWLCCLFHQCNLHFIFRSSLWWKSKCIQENQALFKCWRFKIFPHEYIKTQRCEANHARCHHFLHSGPRRSDSIYFKDWKWRHFIFWPLCLLFKGW